MTLLTSINHVGNVNTWVEIRVQGSREMRSGEQIIEEGKELIQKALQRGITQIAFNICPDNLNYEDGLKLFVSAMIKKFRIRAQLAIFSETSGSCLQSMHDHFFTMVPVFSSIDEVLMFFGDETPAESANKCKNIIKTSIEKGTIHLQKSLQEIEIYLTNEPKNRAATIAFFRNFRDWLCMKIDEGFSNFYFVAKVFQTADLKEAFIVGLKYLIMPPISEKGAILSFSDLNQSLIEKLSQENLDKVFGNQKTLNRYRIHTSDQGEFAEIFICEKEASCDPYRRNENLNDAMAGNSQIMWALMLRGFHDVVVNIESLYINLEDSCYITFYMRSFFKPLVQNNGRGGVMNVPFYWSNHLNSHGYPIFKNLDEARVFFSVPDTIDPNIKRCWAPK